MTRPEKESGKFNNISTIAKEHYMQKLMEIIKSANSTWSGQKSDTKQILDYVTEEDERIYLW
jgi:hypothetical protein